jgi:extracellular factor (EF) 3-hydroxypalmitic acid methyl ester biosynthesis protein
MATGTLLLDGLNEDDIAWFFSTAEERSLEAGTFLIREGAPIETLFIVLQGYVAVTLQAVAGHQIAALGQGQVVGEMSFLERVPARASVSAVEAAQVISIPFSAIDARIASDVAFANRFHLSLARVLSQRLRRSISTPESISLADVQKSSQETVTLPPQWNDGLAIAEAFKSELEDVASKESDRTLSEASEKRILEAFAAFSGGLNRLLGSTFTESDRVRDEIGWRIRSEVLPLIKASQLLERIINKPRGVPADHRVLESIYNRSVSGMKGLGPSLDRAFLAEPICEAMRKRRAFVADTLVQAVRAKPKKTTLVTSLVCGPADEIFDTYPKIQNPGDLHTTLIDLDSEAILYVNAKRERAFLEPHITTINENVVYLANGQSKVSIPPQDLVYSIGLIDSHDDATVVKILDFIHGLLKPGGSVLLANVQPGNASRELLKHILDWRMVHRTRDDLNAIFKRSRFGKSCNRFRTEEKGIFLFAESVV